MTREIEEWLLKTPVGHEAAHRMSAPNKTVVLFAGRMSLRQNGRETGPAKGRIIFKWLPMPRALFEINHLPVTRPVSLEDAELRVPIYGLPAQSLSCGQRGLQDCARAASTIDKFLRAAQLTFYSSISQISTTT
jgi:hypothetical protein